jgi:hypothetical protein
MPPALSVVPDSDDDGRRKLFFERFVLDPANRSVPNIDIAEAITDATPTHTIDGASTLELAIQDTDLALLRGDFLTGWTWGSNLDRDEKHWIRDGRTIDARFGEDHYRLVSLTKGEQQDLGLTFEDRTVGKLRERVGAFKVYRSDKVTRARFVKMLCDRAGVKSHIPEINVVQPQLDPEAATGEHDARRDGTRTARPGISKNADLEGKAKLGPAQIALANTALNEADRLRAPYRAIIALLEALIVEAPDFKNPTGGHGTSVGPLQLTNIHLGGSVERRRNTRVVVRLFLESGFTGKGGAMKLARENPNQTAGWIAQQVQGSAHPSRYNQYSQQAQKIYREFFGGSSEGGGETTERTVEKPYPFSRGKKESSWDAIRRLAEEVGWYAFVRRGVLWYVSGDYLRRQQVKYAISETDEAVESVGFELDLGARDLIADVEVKAFADLWDAPPGTAIRLTNEMGPAEGRWIVHEITGSAFDEVVSITLQKPLPAKPEPAPELETETVAANEREASESGTGLREKIVQVAENSLTSKTGFRRYSQAGAPNLTTVLPKTGRSDCSQWIAAVYHRAGAKSPGTWTGDMLRKGKKVSKPKLGDLVCGANHVELYVGNGKTIGHGSPPIDYSTAAHWRNQGFHYLTYDFLDD